MRVKAIAMSLMLSLAVPQNVYAQNTDITSEAFLRAALTVMTFDYFRTKCQQGNGFVASDAAKKVANYNLRVRMGGKRYLFRQRMRNYRIILSLKEHSVHFLVQEQWQLAEISQLLLGKTIPFRLMAKLCVVKVLVAGQGLLLPAV